MTTDGDRGTRVENRQLQKELSDYRVKTDKQLGQLQEGQKSLGTKIDALIALMTAGKSIATEERAQSGMQEAAIHPPGVPTRQEASTSAIPALNSQDRPQEVLDSQMQPPGVSRPPANLQLQHQELVNQQQQFHAQSQQFAPQLQQPTQFLQQQPQFFQQQQQFIPQFQNRYTQEPNYMNSAGFVPSSAMNSAGAMSGNRYMDVRCPGYNGVDSFKSWWCKCEQFFLYNRVPEQQKMEVVYYGLSDAALEWHHSFVESRRGTMLTWDLYIQAMAMRFDRNQLGDPIIEMMELRQIGSVDEFQYEFQRSNNWDEQINAYIM